MSNGIFVPPTHERMAPPRSAPGLSKHRYRLPPCEHGLALEVPECNALIFAGAYGTNAAVVEASQSGSLPVDAEVATTNETVAPYGIRATPKDDGVLITVADTGIGIAANDIPKAFERFGQADAHLARQYEGAGLGLPLSKELVELHGGSLTLASKLNEGTTVSIFFPCPVPSKTELVA